MKTTVDRTIDLFILLRKTKVFGAVESNGSKVPRKNQRETNSFCRVGKRKKGSPKTTHGYFGGWGENFRLAGSWGFHYFFTNH